jgi:hypothetical protein
MAAIYRDGRPAQAVFFAGVDSSFCFPMIPREITKKNPADRAAHEPHRDRVCGSNVGSARFTVRTPAASKINPQLNCIRPLKGRERRARDQTLWTPQPIHPTFTP